MSLADVILAVVGGAVSGCSAYVAHAEEAALLRHVTGHDWAVAVARALLASVGDRIAEVRATPLRLGGIAEGAGGEAAEASCAVAGETVDAGSADFTRCEVAMAGVFVAGIGARAIRVLGAGGTLALKSAAVRVAIGCRLSGTSSSGTKATETVYAVDAIARTGDRILTAELANRQEKA